MVKIVTPYYENMKCVQIFLVIVQDGNLRMGSYTNFFNRYLLCIHEKEIMLQAQSP